MKYVLLIIFLMFASLVYAEEEFFIPFGFEVFNEEGHRIKFLYDVEHQKLRFRVFETEEIYYEGSIDLIRIWEGYVDGTDNPSDS